VFSLLISIWRYKFFQLQWNLCPFEFQPIISQHINKVLPRGIHVWPMWHCHVTSSSLASLMARTWYPHGLYVIPMTLSIVRLVLLVPWTHGDMALYLWRLVLIFGHCFKNLVFCWEILVEFPRVSFFANLSKNPKFIWGRWSFEWNLYLDEMLSYFLSVIYIWIQEGADYQYLSWMHMIIQAFRWVGHAHIQNDLNLDWTKIWDMHHW